MSSSEGVAKIITYVYTDSVTVFSIANNGYNISYDNELQLYEHRAEWLGSRASDSRLRRPGFESCVAVLKSWARIFTQHCSSSLSYK